VLDRLTQVHLGSAEFLVSPVLRVAQDLPGILAPQVRKEWPESLVLRDLPDHRELQDSLDLKVCIGLLLKYLST